MEVCDVCLSLQMCVLRQKKIRKLQQKVDG